MQCRPGEAAAFWCLPAFLLLCACLDELGAGRLPACRTFRPACPQSADQLPPDPGLPPGLDRIMCTPSSR